MTPNTNHTNLKEQIYVAIEPLMVALGESKQERRDDTQSFLDDAVERIIALFAGVGAAPTQLTASEENRIALQARKDELHLIGESMLTPKGMMWIIARNQELKAELSNPEPEGRTE